MKPKQPELEQMTYFFIHNGFLFDHLHSVDPLSWDMFNLEYLRVASTPDYLQKFEILQSYLSADGSCWDHRHFRNTLF